MQIPTIADSSSRINEKNKVIDITTCKSKHLHEYETNPTRRKADQREIESTIREINNVKVTKCRRISNLEIETCQKINIKEMFKERREREREKGKKGNSGREGRIQITKSQKGFLDHL